MGKLKKDVAGQIAIIGMACRLPGAKNTREFWENLAGGIESIRFFSDEELAHVDPDMLSRPNYVKARGMLEGIDQFDAAFFGLTPREAGLTDPQQRFFFECAWEALEDAGCHPDSHKGSIAVFAGGGTNDYLERLHRDPALVSSAGEMQLVVGNHPDHLAPRLSYLANLRGPSVPINTACSTSLVAIHIACQNLLNYDCDLALAGGVSILIPAKDGYLHEEGGILSPDGHCRSFDARSKGTVLGDGVGVVVLKRLEEALADGDAIRAVILGSAYNNDGAAKIGYTAPSVEGQRRVVREALSLAEVEPAELSYIEAHGTATTLGDPIEIEALTQAFGKIQPNQTCAIGSVKSNIGHCNSAAGVAGLIKTVLCLEHKTLVPSLHFESPNPKIDFARGPFRVNTQTRPWDREMRVAGVSSFGIGGTNAHIVLAQAPEAETTSPARPLQIATLSARTAKALEKRSAQLAEFLSAHPDTHPADLAFTLNTGRKPMEHRRSLVFETSEQAMAALAKPAAATQAASQPRVVFLFPGQGADYENFGGDLYEKEAVFREEIDRCCAFLKADLGVNLADYLFGPQSAEMRAQLKRPTLWQPAIFVSEYALARLWMSWGIMPEAMIGHSIGEFVAAVLAGVLDLESALKLIAHRGRGTDAIAEGAMVAVIRPLEQLREHIVSPICLAAVNGPSLCVLSGPSAEIDRLTAELKADGAHTIKLPTTHAFHSEMMEPLMAPLSQLAAGFSLKPPSIPIISDVTGIWLTDEQATDPTYWGDHLRRPVRFNDGLETLFLEADRVYLEVGPGKVLSNLVKRHPGTKAAAIQSLDAKGENGLDPLLKALGALWCEGVAIDWEAFYGDEGRRKLHLPVYPFEHQAYWLGASGDAPMAASDPIAIKKDFADWFYLPVWCQAPKPLPPHLDRRLETGAVWLLFEDGRGLCDRLARRLGELKQVVVRVKPGDSFNKNGEFGYILDPRDADGCDLLVAQLNGRDLMPSYIVHAWRLDGSISFSSESLAAGLSLGFDCLLRLARAIGLLNLKQKIRLAVLTDGMHAVLNGSDYSPEKAAILGALRIIPNEMVNFTCRGIDFAPGEDWESRIAPDAIIADTVLPFKSENYFVTYRAGSRWVEAAEPVHLPEVEGQSPYKQNGVYVIVNGIQEIGIALAGHLARTANAKVVLLDRIFFPKPSEWDAWIEEQGESDYISLRIRRLREVMGHGGRIEVRTANPVQLDRLSAAKDEIVAAHGPIHGVFHLNQPFEDHLILVKPMDAPSQSLRLKMTETNNLAQVFGGPETLTFFTEHAGEGGFGQVEQAAAYTFDASYANFLAIRHGDRVKIVEWGTRQWSEISQDMKPAGSSVQAQLDEKRAAFGMTRDQCLHALGQILQLRGIARVIVSTRDYLSVLRQQLELTPNFFSLDHGAGQSSHPRPDLSVPYAAPETELQGLVSEKWRSYFDIDKVGIHDNFFDLGGHSLIAVQLLNSLNETFSIKLSLDMVFNAPTVAEMSEVISHAQVAVEDTDELDRLLSEIEGLSDEEIDKVLQSAAKK